MRLQGAKRPAQRSKTPQTGFLIGFKFAATASLARHEPRRQEIARRSSLCRPSLGEKITSLNSSASGSEAA